MSHHPDIETSSTRTIKAFNIKVKEEDSMFVVLTSVKTARTPQINSGSKGLLIGGALSSRNGSSMGRKLNNNSKITNQFVHRLLKLLNSASGILPGDPKK